MGIKIQAFSFYDFEKAYLCYIKIDNSPTNHTFLDKFTCVFLEKGVYCISIIRICISIYIFNYNIIWIML